LYKFEFEFEFEFDNQTPAPCLSRLSRTHSKLVYFSILTAQGLCDHSSYSSEAQLFFSNVASNRLVFKCTSSPFGGTPDEPPCPPYGPARWRRAVCMRAAAPAASWAALARGGCTRAGAALLATSPL
jgi:hypothetical protein